MTSYRVSEISAASPDLSDPEFDALVADIRAHGQLVPIWKVGDEIIDGRKRLRACQRLGIAPTTVDLSADQDPAALAYSLNILRTHYTTGQRAMFAERRANLADGQRKAGGAIAPAVSLADAACAAGVDRVQVVRARQIRRAAAPELTAAVESGRLSLHAATQIAATVPPSGQPAAVEKVVAASRGKTRQTPARVLGAPTGTFHRSPRRPLALRMERGLDQLETTVGLLAQFAEEGEMRAAWIKRLCAIRAALSRVIAKGRQSA